MTPCPLCGEVVVLGTQDVASIRIDGLLAHRECALRDVIGGIGHLEDHARWCSSPAGPDKGLTFRESALAVDRWVREHGIDAAVSRTIHH